MHRSAYGTDVNVGSFDPCLIFGLNIIFFDNIILYFINYLQLLLLFGLHICFRLVSIVKSFDLEPEKMNYRNFYISELKHNLIILNFLNEWN